MCIREYVQNNQNREQFEQFISTKLGYGRWDAAYWFVGPEEGGAGDCLQMTTRIDQWAATMPAGVFALKDLREYCRRIGVHQFHGFHAATAMRQPTWCSLIQLLGSPNGNPPAWMPVPAQNDPLFDNRFWTRRFQRDYLGRAEIAVRDHNVALLDISPLPSPNETLWLWACVQGTLVEHAATYASRSNFLGREVAPRTSFARRRINLILQRLRVAEKKPELLMFYGCYGRGRNYLTEPITNAVGQIVDPAIIPAWGRPTHQNPVVYARITHEDQTVTHVMWVHHPRVWSAIYLNQIRQCFHDNGFEPWALNPEPQ